MTLPDSQALAVTLRQREDETDEAWISRLRAHFEAEQRESVRQFAERWADADRQP